MSEYSPSGISLTTLQRFHRHVLMYMELSHANIVSLLGVFSSDRFPYACVFESAGKENLPEHLVSNPGASRLKLVGLDLSFRGRLTVLTAYGWGISWWKLLGVSITPTIWISSTVA